MRSNLCGAVSLVLLAGLTTTSWAAPARQLQVKDVDHKDEEGYGVRKRGTLGWGIGDMIGARAPPVEVPVGAGAGGAGRGGAGGGRPGGSGPGGGAPKTGGANAGPGAKNNKPPLSRGKGTTPPAGGNAGPSNPGRPVGEAPAPPVNEGGAGSVAQAQVAIRTKGARNMQDLAALRAPGRPPVDDAAVVRNYQQRSSQFYSREVRNYNQLEADLKVDFSGPGGPQVKAFLKNNGIDFEADAAGIKRVDVWGKPGKEGSDVFDDPTVVTFFMNAEKGWMYTVRVFRTQDPRDPVQFVDFLYVPKEQLPANDRIFISEHLYQEWTKAAGGQRLSRVAVGDISNVGTLQMLSDLAARAGVAPGQTVTGQFTRASDPPAFDEVVGGSTGDPIVRGMISHFDPRRGPYFGAQPQSVAYRYTKSPTSNEAVEFNQGGDRDAFVVITLG